MGKVNITAEDLSTSAKKFRKELLMQPVHALGRSLAHMTLRTGIRYEEVVGELSGDIEVGPYSETRIDEDDVAINPRRLRTYLGSVVKPFSPNSVYQTIYGSAITKGQGLTTVEIARTIAAFLSAKIGYGLDRHLFNAVRNDKGNKTVDLFNGFDTITAFEIASGNISATAGNLFAFTEAIDATNAVDAIKEYCRSASDFLQETEGVKLFLPRTIYNAYLDDYKATTGSTPYNKEFKKTFVEGFENISFVPMYQKRGSEFMQLTTKSNMLVGVNQQGEEEQLEIEKHAAFVLQFIATLFFGVNYESLDSSRLHIGKLYGAESSAPDQPKEGDETDDNTNNSND